MRELKEVFSKDINKVVSWHKDKKGRKKFWTLCWLTYLGIFLIFAAASALFALAGLYFDANAINYPWAMHWDDSTSLGFFVGAIVLYVVGIGLGIFFAFYFPCLFKESQNIYLASEEYRVAKLQYLRTDLTTIDPKELKWLLKLKYIDRAHYNSAITLINKKEATM
ncbi:MAG: hypothetical protein HUJ52_01605 [Malacoplasma sp.]|nr:hypothetical protein [Malacoplasma sp.]